MKKASTTVHCTDGIVREFGNNKTPGIPVVGSVEEDGTLTITDLAGNVITDFSSAKWDSFVVEVVEW